MTAQVGLCQQNILQVTVLSDGLFGGGLQQEVSGHFAHAIGQRNADRFGEDQPPGGVDVFSHPFGM